MPSKPKKPLVGPQPWGPETEAKFQALEGLGQKLKEARAGMVSRLRKNPNLLNQVLLALKEHGLVWWNERERERGKPWQASRRS